ncbi:MAG TPA: serine/threonine-protein kinase [Myxococcales bacterium]|nr:serine/threonine-protein kinase [Myxococcales bacterium]
MPEAPSDVGSYFGKYFLMKKLAAGGMGEIYLAKQQGPAGFQKILVVKKILGHLTENKEFIEAFLGEARLAAQMNHRNVVQVFELGEETGSYFIAMEYVAGKALREVIDAAAKKKEKLHPEHSRLIAEMICDGASYAHNLTDMTGRSLNLVHRDLNPQNVLISYTGDVKVIDFGIAKSEMSTVKTEAGMIKGKFVYMSPEQSLAKKLDKRSDIFAIGISLYEMLTGINPFHKNNIVLTLEAVQRFDPAPPSQTDPVFAPFDPIVAKALAKDRDRRYSDAAEMQDDLRRIVLPRPPERLGQFMARTFRAQLEEEQKMLMDSDSMKLTTSGPKKTPARAAPATTPPKPAPAAKPVESGATEMLQSPRKAPSVGKPPPARIAPRPPPAGPPPKATPAGDTLVDGGMQPPGNNTGATAMLGQSPQRPGDTMPEHMEPEEGDFRTALLNDAPPRAKKPSKPSSTDIISPEDSAAARQAALAKMAEGPKGVIRTRTRPDQSTPPPSQKKMWIILGVAGLFAVAAIVALLFLLSDDSGSGTPRHKRAPPPEQTQAAPVEQPAPAPAPAAEEPKTETARPQRKASEESAEKPSRKQTAAPAGRSMGTLTLNPGPNVPVTYAGAALPKQVGAFDLPVTSATGSITVGDDNTPFKVTIDYTVSNGSVLAKVSSTPWAIASVNGPSKGRTPVGDIAIGAKSPTLVELKKPGNDTSMSLRLKYTPN